MWDAKRFREILIAETALQRGLADPRDVAAALQRYWDQRDVKEVSIAQEIARIAGLPTEALDDVVREVDEIIAQAGGDAAVALLSRDSRDRFAGRTLSRASVTVPTGEGGSARPVPVHMRTLPPDRYQEFLPAGEGGMGVVYWALDTDLNRQVAFKVVHPRHVTGGGSPPPAEPLELAAPKRGTPASEAFEEIKTRFLQEALVTGGLEHPGIVPVYELGQTKAGMPYYTMRFVRGQRTLREAIAEAQDAPVEKRLLLLEPFLKVCDTMHYAHSRGIVHRDLKPENIALGQFGEVVVLDWGLAKFQEKEDTGDSRWQKQLHDIRDEGGLETNADAIGTPGYMSPEAALGAAELIDERSDVYSLGVMLYEILCGRLPFECRTFAQYRDSVKTLDAKPPREIAPAVPEALSQLCISTLSRDRVARPAAAEDLATAIRNWQAHAAAESEVKALVREAETAWAALPPVGSKGMLEALDRVSVPSEQALRIKPTAPVPKALLQQVANMRTKALEAHARQTRRHVLGRLGIAALFLVALVTTVFMLLFDAKRREANEQRTVAVDALARAQEAEAEEEKLRLEAEKTARREIQAREAAEAMEKKEADARQAAQLSAREARQAELRATDMGVKLRDSTDLSRSLAMVNASHLVVHSAPALAALLGLEADAIRRSPETTGLLHDVIPWCLEYASWPTPAVERVGAGFSQDGQLAMLALQDGTIQVRDLEGRAVGDWKVEDTAVDAAWWSGPGRTIITRSDGGEVRTWSAEGRPLRTYPSDIPLPNAMVSPGGSQMLVWGIELRDLYKTGELDPCADRGMWSFYAIDTCILWGAGEEPVAVADGATWLEVGFTPQDVAIALAVEDQTVTVVRIRDGAELTRLTEAPERIKLCRIAPDGAHFAIALADGTVLLYDSEGGNLGNIRTDLLDLEALDFSASSDAILCTPSAGARQIWTLGGGFVSRVWFWRDPCVPNSLASEERQLTDGLLAIRKPGSVRLCVLPRVADIESGTLNGGSMQYADVDLPTRVIPFAGTPGRSLAVSPDGDTVLDAPLGGEARLNSVRKGSEFRATLDIVNRKKFFLSPGRRTVFTAREDVAHLHALDGALLWKATTPGDAVTALASSEDHALFAAGTVSGRIHLWNADGQPIGSWTAHKETTAKEVAIWKTPGAAGAPEVCCWTEPYGVSLWRTDGTRRANIVHGRTGGTVAYLAPSGEYLVTTMKPPPPPCAIPEDFSAVPSIPPATPEASAPPGPPPPLDPASASSSDDESPFDCKLWSRDGQLLGTLRGHEDACWTVAFSEDASEILTASASSAIRWSRQGEVLGRYDAKDGGEVLDAFFTPDGIRILEWAQEHDGLHLRTMDGTSVCTVRAPVSAVLLRRSRGDEAKSPCPGRYGRGVHRTEDGRLFLLELSKGAFSVFRSDGQELFYLHHGTAQLEGAQFSNDGTVLLVVNDGGPRLLKLDDDELRTRAVEVAPRQEFLPEERAFFRDILTPPEAPTPTKDEDDPEDR